MMGSRLCPPPPYQGQNTTQWPEENNKYIGLSKLFRNNMFPDVEIKVGLNAYGRTFKLHKGILSANSEYFRRMFASNWFKEGREDFVELPEHDAEVFEHMLYWLYDAEVVENRDGYPPNIDMLAKMFQYASYFEIRSLKSEAIAIIRDKLYNRNDQRKYIAGGTQEKNFNLAMDALFVTYSAEKGYYDALILALCRNDFVKRILSVPRLKQVLCQESELLMRLLEVHLDDCDDRHVDKDAWVVDEGSVWDSN